MRSVHVGDQFSSVPCRPPADPTCVLSGYSGHLCVRLAIFVWQVATASKRVVRNNAVQPILLYYLNHLSSSVVDFELMRRSCL